MPIMGIKVSVSRTDRVKCIVRSLECMQVQIVFTRIREVKRKSNESGEGKLIKSESSKKRAETNRHYTV